MEHLWKVGVGVDLPLPLPRLTYAESMRRYGATSRTPASAWSWWSCPTCSASSEFKVFQTRARLGRQDQGHPRAGLRRLLPQGDRRADRVRAAVPREGARLGGHRGGRQHPQLHRQVPLARGDRRAADGPGGRSRRPAPAGRGPAGRRRRRAGPPAAAPGRAARPDPGRAVELPLGRRFPALRAGRGRRREAGPSPVQRPALGPARPAGERRRCR